MTISSTDLVPPFMQAIASYNKTALFVPLLGALLLHVGAFITICVYISHGAIEDVKHTGVGGRVGFSLILFALLSLAFWAFTTFSVLKGNFTPESYTTIKVGAAFFILASFNTCLIIHGQAIQIIQLINTVFNDGVTFRGSFVHGADGSVALLSIAMVCTIIFEFFFVFWKGQILGSSGQAAPQQPNDMGYVQQPDQNNYYAQPQTQPGGYAQPQPDGGYAAPQNSGVYA